MNVRSLVAVAAIGFGVLSAPANAGQIETFEAWNHEYWVPSLAHSEIRDASTITQPAWSAGLTPAPTRFASTADRIGRAAVGVPAGTRTINVWGARIDAPTY